MTVAEGFPMPILPHVVSTWRMLFIIYLLLLSTFYLVFVLPLFLVIYPTKSPIQSQNTVIVVYFPYRTYWKISHDRKKQFPEDGEMARWLKALAAFTKDLGSVPSTHVVAHICNSSSMRSDALF